MIKVLTLIAGKTKKALAAETVDRLRRALQAAGVVAGSADWLSDGEACDIQIDGDAQAAAVTARRVVSGDPVDICITPAAGRRKRLFLADMDSTMIGQECIDELAAEIGVGGTVAAITDKAMRGEIEFVPALRQRVRLFAGMPVTTVEKVLGERITLTSGGRTVVATMRANGAYASLVSGGIAAFVEVVANRLGFDEYRANKLVVENGAFTGEVAEPVLDRDAKLARLRELLAERGLDAADCLAVGDGANDLAMIQHAGLGVAFHAKAALEAEADVAIRHADLTALLFVQGYRREEFVH